MRGSAGDGPHASNETYGGRSGGTREEAGGAKGALRPRLRLLQRLWLLVGRILLRMLRFEPVSVVRVRSMSSPSKVLPNKSLETGVRLSGVPMKVPAPPEDLVAFLRSGRRLEFILLRPGLISEIGQEKEPGRP